MKKLFIFVLFLGCSEHDTNTCDYKWSMTISDAIPIQFWVNGQETYNQKEVCGINQFCFCQQFQCDDDIRIQFQDDTYAGYSLRAISESSGSTIATMPFSSIADGTWELSFIPSENGICDEQIRLEIFASRWQLFDYSFDHGEQAFTNIGTRGGGNGGISPNGEGWTQTTNNGSNPGNPSGVFVYKGLGTMEFGGIANSPQSNSETLFQVFDAVSGHFYLEISSTNYTMAYNGTLQILEEFLIKQNIVTVIATHQKIIDSDGVSPDTGNLNETVDLGDLDNVTRIEVAFSKSSGAATVWSFTDFVYNSINLYADIDVVMAYSDCISIKTSHECTELIEYSNSKDFADIDYSGMSPNSEFSIRVPAVFFHEDNPEEMEDIETSGQTIVRLRNEIKVKRRLDLGYMPDYMHRKMMLILAHDTIEIDGDTWIKRDSYEKIPPANKRFPLKMANVLLTLQGYIKRNIL